MNDRNSMKRTMGAVGATVTLVGSVVGISIFILPGTLAASVGPAVILAYALASLMAIFSCVIAAQVGSIFPVSGASFVAVSRLVSPYWGFAIIWMIIGAAAVAVAVVAYGFADYLSLIWPWLDRRSAAMMLIVALSGLNLMGIRNTVMGQALLVATFMVALAVFCGAGLANLNPDLLNPFAPNGLKPVLSATIPAFFSYAGFMVIIEIGGEIRNPAKNIPRALLTSFLIVVVTYTLVSLVLVGIIPWQELGETGAPVGAAAAKVLPGWIANGITLAAIGAAASTVNVFLLGYSRDVLALARARVLPEFMARVSKKHGEPLYGVLYLTGLSLVAVGIGGQITDYATLAVIGLLVLQILVGVAMLFLPQKLPELYQRTTFRVGRKALPFFSIGLILLSFTFLAIAILDSMITAGLAGIYLMVGTIFYLLRRDYLRSRGINIDRMVREDEELENQSLR